MPSSFRPALPSKKGVAVAAWVLLGILDWPGHQAAAAAPEDYAVIVSPDVAVSNLDFDRLRRLFLFREKFWEPGRSVTVLLSEDGLQTGSFLVERIYRMDYPSLKRYIFQKLYQQEIDLAPKVVASDEIAVNFVAAGRGLIALVRFSAVRGQSVKMVSVNGRLPGAEGYVLRR